MKAITLRQPFADLVVTGRKRFETRKFKPKPGKILIHAARRCVDHPVSGFTQRETETLPIGVIVGWVTIAEAMDMEELDDWCQWEGLDDIPPQEHRWGYWSADTIAWLLTDPVKLKTPIPCIGNIDFWTPPQAVLEKISALSPTDIVQHDAAALNV